MILMMPLVSLETELDREMSWASPILLIPSIEGIQSFAARPCSKEFLCRDKVKGDQLIHVSVGEAVSFTAASLSLIESNTPVRVGMPVGVSSRIFHSCTSYEGMSLSTMDGSAPIGKETYNGGGVTLPHMPSTSSLGKGSKMGDNTTVMSQFQNSA